MSEFAASCCLSGDGESKVSNFSLHSSACGGGEAMAPQV